MNEKELRSKLPIGSNERILNVMHHHWFAYVSVYLGSAFIILVILGAAIGVKAFSSDLELSSAAANAVMVGGIVFATLVGLFSLIPAWLKKQEYIVLTEEAIMQVNKPSLFTNKVSQLNLNHISDVTVNQDVLGTMLGFGRIVIETPGEQDNYSFTVIPTPHQFSQAIIEAHENYSAALESGQIETTFSQRKSQMSAAAEKAQSTASVSTHDKKSAAAALGHIASEDSDD